MRGIATRTGFSKDLIFRKYLRYILNERPFDTDAVADIVARTQRGRWRDLTRCGRSIELMSLLQALRNACQLSDAMVQDVLKETAQRSFKARPRAAVDAWRGQC